MAKCRGIAAALAAALAASLLGALLVGRHGALAWVFVALGCCRADCSTHRCEEALLRRLCEQHVICLCSRLPPLAPMTAPRTVELARREDGRQESSLGVVALFRNEHAMLEWLKHHHDEGATEFVLCDDNSTDPSVRESAVAFRRTHDVRLVLWRRLQAACGQICVYRRSVKMARSVWLLFVDLDEFAFARSGHGTIRAYLGRLPRAVSTVYLQPHVFGSMGLVDAPKSVVSTYLCRGDVDQPRGSNSPRDGKTVVRRLAVRTPGPHHPYRADGLCVNADLSSPPATPPKSTFRCSSTTTSSRHGMRFPARSLLITPTPQSSASRARSMATPRVPSRPSTRGAVGHGGCASRCEARALRERRSGLESRGAPCGR